MSMTVTGTQPTPNPNALKFLLDAIHFNPPRSYFNAAAATGDMLAEKLFAISGVTSVLLLGDFVTVNKSATAAWKSITPKVKKVLNAEP